MNLPLGHGNEFIRVDPTYLRELEKDAERYRKMKTFALPRYVVKVRSGDSMSTYREGEVIVRAETWEELEASLDNSVIEGKAKP